MPIARFEMPDGRIARFEVPEGTTPEQAQTLIQSQLPALSQPITPELPESLRARPEAPSEVPGPRRGMLASVGQGLANIGAGAIRGAGSIGATILAPADYLEAAIRRRVTGEDVTGAELNRQRREGMTTGLQMLGAEPESLAFKAGQIGGEIAGTAGVGGALAAPVRMAAQAVPAAAPVAAALQSGGMAAGTPLALRAGAGALTGGAGAALVEPENALAGALVGGGVSAIAPPALNLLGRAAGAVRDFRDGNQLAARTAREAIGTPDKVAAARAALQAPEAQGLTAQQALARSGLVLPSAQATLEKAIKASEAVDTRAAIEAAQETARKSTLKSITPDLTAAVNARRAKSKPLYDAADRAVVSIDQDFANILGRMPEGVINKAAEIAKMEGRPFVMGRAAPAKIIEEVITDAAGVPSIVAKEVPGQAANITGESMHYIRRALSDVAYAPPAATGIGRDTQIAARQLLDDYTKLFEKKVPDYEQARKIFSNLSAPVNQAQVLKEMASVLEQPGGGERIKPFLNVLGRGEQAMLKRAGGRGAPRFEALSEVLTPDQLGKVREIAKQLETETKVSGQISEGLQRASDLIKEEIPNIRIPNPFNVLISNANKVLAVLSNKLSEETVDKLGQAALSAKSFDELLGALPASERSKVLKVISSPETWAKTTPAISGAIAAQQPTNALAPAREEQNALAR